MSELIKGNRLIADFSFLKEDGGIEKLSSYLDEICKDDSMPSKHDFLVCLMYQGFLTPQQVVEISYSID